MHSKNVNVRYFLSWMVLICTLPFLSCTTKVLVAMDPAKLEKERLLHAKLLSGKEVKVKEPRIVAFALSQVAGLGELN